MRQKLFAMVVMVGVLTATGIAYAQAPPVQPRKDVVAVPLKITVVITRHKSDKAQTIVSRLPFELWVNTGDTATVRLGSDVPIPTTTFTAAEPNKVSSPVTSFSYRSIGTSLTIEARVLGDGLYQLPISIEDSQVVPATGDPNAGGPRLLPQSFRTQASPILRDGQTVQHSLSTDRVTGDITKVDVTLTVVK